MYSTPTECATEFGFMVSHELRAKLRVMNGLVDLLREELSDDATATARYSLVQLGESVSQMQNMLTALLNMAKPNAPHLLRKETDLSVMALHIVEQLQLLEPTRQVQVHVQSDVRAVGEPTLLYEVLQNLLSNAWKFTRCRTDARIEFGVSHECGEPIYCVRDNGIGIETRQIGDLFKPFVRLENVGDIPGEGVGLYAVKRIVERHGGQVWASTDHLPGAKVCFTLGAAGKRSIGAN